MPPAPHSKNPNERPSAWRNVTVTPTALPRPQILPIENLLLPFLAEGSASNKQLELAELVKKRNIARAVNRSTPPRLDISRAHAIKQFTAMLERPGWATNLRTETTIIYLKAKAADGDTHKPSTPQRLVSGSQAVREFMEILDRPVWEFNLGDGDSNLRTNTTTGDIGNAVVPATERRNVLGDSSRNTKVTFTTTPEVETSSAKGADASVKTNFSPPRSHQTTLSSSTFCVSQL
ncbi:hypothetical protein DFH27DRAFT_645089 [Peziza echinospora]|nr:hypothetical protein DFH27DRAFT_645089 [Peziza echinospora]